MVLCPTTSFLSALQEDEKNRQREMSRQIVMSVSRGNVGLQLGLYVTEADKEVMRRKVFDYVIKAPI